MIGQLIDVALQNQVISLAKITEFDGDSKYKVKYMSPTSKRWGDRRIYNYEKEEYEIEKENICGFYDTENEEIVGYEKIDDGFVLCESDSEYEPSESESDEDEDEYEDEDEESESESED